MSCFHILNDLCKYESFVARHPALLARSTVLDRTSSVSRRVIAPLGFGFDVLIDARYPAIDLVSRTAFAALIYMLYLCSDCFLCRFDRCIGVVLTVLEQVLDDLHCVFITSPDVAKGLVGAGLHEHIGHRRHSDAEEGMRVVVRPNSSLAFLTVTFGRRKRSPLPCHSIALKAPVMRRLEHPVRAICRPMY